MWRSEVFADTVGLPLKWTEKCRLIFFSQKYVCSRNDYANELYLKSISLGCAQYVCSCFTFVEENFKRTWGLLSHYAPLMCAVSWLIAVGSVEDIEVFARLKDVLCFVWLFFLYDNLLKGVNFGTLTFQSSSYLRCSS